MVATGANEAEHLPMHLCDGTRAGHGRQEHARPHNVICGRTRFGQRRDDDAEASPRLSPTSSGQESSGHTGPVPETQT